MVSYPPSGVLLVFLFCCGSLQFNFFNNGVRFPFCFVSCSESRSFRALQILTHLLPPTASGKRGSTRISVKSALSYMLDIKPVGKLLLS